MLSNKHLKPKTSYRDNDAIKFTQANYYSPQKVKDSLLR